MRMDRQLCKQVRWVVPTPEQIVHTKAVVHWYLSTYFRAPSEPGTLAAFADQEVVGSFAIDLAAVRANRPAALFKLLIATIMFQRRRDVVVQALMRSLTPHDVWELSSQDALVGLARANSCRHSAIRETLHRTCDLHKTSDGMPTCSVRHSADCYLKRHSALLKRYGDFGKYPTSAALLLDDLRVRDLPGLYEQVTSAYRSPTERANVLKERLCEIFRVSSKIASMFLALVSNPDLTSNPPWEERLDWTQFVVVDSNVESFLESIGYSGPRSYNGRVAFIQVLARRINLRRLDSRLHAFNPRLVQQAMYIFMSRSNRNSSDIDCWREKSRCESCPSTLSTRCPVRQRPTGHPMRKDLP
jgi:hypothetical protein